MRTCIIIATKVNSRATSMPIDMKRDTFVDRNKLTAPVNPRTRCFLEVFGWSTVNSTLRVAAWRVDASRVCVFENTNSAENGAE